MVEFKTKKAMTLNHKIIWITGASSGIGKALALHLSHNESIKLILSARRESALNEVKTLCKYPENISVLPFDLANLNDMPEIANQAIKVFGNVDILVNNGGVSQRSLIIETSIEVDKKLMEVDYLGTVALSKAILPHFIKNQSGHFAVVSSLMGNLAHHIALVIVVLNTLCMVFLMPCAWNTNAMVFT